MILSADLHWTAGFLEGEGCFTWLKNKWGGGSPRVQVHQVQKQPVARLRDLFGGSLTLEIRKHINHQDCYQWSVCARTAAGLMMTMYPLMSPARQRRIREVLGLWRIQRPANSLKRTCPQGHDYISVQRNGGQRIARRCLMCKRVRRAA